MSGTPREIFDCERVKAYLDSYLEGQVPPPEARAMRLHIHACAGCRPKVLARDPLQLFAPLADQEQGEAFWAGFWPAVRADIHAERARGEGFRSFFARPSVAWATAAALLVVAGLALARTWRLEPADLGRPTAAEIAAADQWQRVLPDTGQIGAPALASVEEVRSPSAQVLSMKVFGEDEAVTEVVLIVDAAIDL